MAEVENIRRKNFSEKEYLKFKIMTTLKKERNTASIKPAVGSSAFLVTIDGWFVSSHSSAKILFTPHRDNAELFEKDEATEMKRRVQSGCGKAFLSWSKEDVLILGTNE